MKRRNFIFITLAGISTITTAEVYKYKQATQNQPILSSPHALASLMNPEGLHAIGQKYRQQVPGEKSKRTLIRLLLDNTTGDTNSLPAAIQQKITQDFKLGNTIEINGWILSVTEARQCALFSFTTFG